MEIKIFKEGEEIRKLPLELMHISPKFLSKSLAEIGKIKDAEELIHDLTKNREQIANDVGEYVSITLVNEEQVEIPFEVFFNEVIDTLRKLVKIYQSVGSVEIAIE